ncbi:MAG: PAS-domain containing protein [Paracoccaceae bacterium]
MAMIEILVIVAAAAVSVLGAVLFLAHAFKDYRAPLCNTDSPFSFLFNGNVLVHSTPGSLELVQHDDDATDWSMLRDGVLARFPEFPIEPPNTAGETIDIDPFDPKDDGILRIQSFGEHARVELVRTSHEELSQSSHELHTANAKFERLERICEASPYPIWQTDKSGDVVWSNDAYAQLSEKVLEQKDGSDGRRSILDLQPTDNTTRRARASVALKDLQTPSWYDVTATPQPDGVIHHATNIDAVIRAEIAQRNFVQTLAKTFAQLSIGLAIFDRNGQLALFNPALVDLSGLPAVFLSTRPDLLTFFDRLRDNRVMPEPKNYSSWRQEIANVIKAATNGTYQETWSLDSGQTFRVSGRPHPDGAVAFLLEDISAEVSLTRNFRAELELGQSLLDTFQDGLVVFSSAGILTFCNRSYCEFWGVDPEATFVDISINDSVKTWSAECQPNPAWGDIREFVMKIGDRATWDTWIERKNGVKIFVTVAPIASGATVVRFDSRAPLDKSALDEHEKVHE